MGAPTNKGPVKGPATVAETVNVAGTEFPRASFEKAANAVSRDFAKGYNEADPGEPGYWRWETLAVDVYASLGLTFPAPETARDVGRRAGAMLRGTYRNGKKRWAAMTDTAEFRSGVIGLYVSAYRMRFPTGTVGK